MVSPEKSDFFWSMNAPSTEDAETSTSVAISSSFLTRFWQFSDPSRAIFIKYKQLY